MVGLHPPQGVRKGDGHGGIGILHHPGLGTPDVFTGRFQQPGLLVPLQDHPEGHGQLQAGIQVILVRKGIAQRIEDRYPVDILDILDDMRMGPDNDIGPVLH